MKQEGIGTVVGTTTSEVLRKLKEAGPAAERRRKAPPGQDTVSISPEAREKMAAEQDGAMDEESEDEA